MTGFRVHRGGATGLWGHWSPTCSPSARSLGGGLPAAAYGGPADLLGLVAPEGPVYQAGTLSGNPLATAAGLATLSLLDDDAYRHLDALAGELMRWPARPPSSGPGAPARSQRAGNLFSVFLTADPVGDYEQPRRQDTAAYARFFARHAGPRCTCPPAPSRPGSSPSSHTDAEVELGSWRPPGRRPAGLRRPSALEP